MYKYACIYRDYYGNLEVPSTFKTNDGYTPDPKGEIPLGNWIGTQRYNCDPESERGQLLLKIGMRFKIKKKAKNDDDFSLSLHKKK